MLKNLKNKVVSKKSEKEAELTLLSLLGDEVENCHNKKVDLEIFALPRLFGHNQNVYLFDARTSISMLPDETKFKEMMEILKSTVFEENLENEKDSLKSKELLSTSFNLKKQTSFNDLLNCYLKEIVPTLSAEKKQEIVERFERNKERNVFERNNISTKEIDKYINKNLKNENNNSNDIEMAM